MSKSPFRAGVAAVLVPLVVGLAACGSSSTGSSSSGSSGGASATASGSGASNVSAATAAVQQYTGKPTPFPVDQPLKTRPTGKSLAYLQCSTPVCGLFAQLLPPTASLLGY
jgi:ribose transport system substrate-binding protein